MKTALINSGYKTHYVTDYQNKRTYPKTLCGQFASHVFDEEDFALAPGTDGICERCKATKRNIQMKAARQ